MKPDTSPAQLSYFLQEDLFLLKSDKPLYQSAPQQITNIEQDIAPVAIQPAPEVTPAAATSTPPLPTITPSVTFNYLGGNQKNFLVLVHYPAADFMAPEHLTALTGTLGRISLTQDDVAIVNMAKTEAKEWVSISKFFSPQKLLILGAKALPAAIPALNINAIQNTGNITTLYTFGFDEMMGNKDNTRTFWNLIKTF